MLFKCVKFSRKSSKKMTYSETYPFFTKYFLKMKQNKVNFTHMLCKSLCVIPLFSGVPTQSILRPLRDCSTVLPHITYYLLMTTSNNNLTA